MEIPKHFFALFSGNRRARPLPTLLIAAVVTALVAVPLTVRALDAQDDPDPLPVAADASLVLVDTADAEPAPLDEAVVAGPLLISFDHPTATGVSFNLFEAGEAEPLVASQDLEGPHFDLLVGERGTGRPLDSTLLDDGRYELFLTVATGVGEQRTAVSFAVKNP